jgi:hypothetical protein
MQGTTQELQNRKTGDMLLIDVPWEQANGLFAHLNQHSIRVLFWADLVQRKAWLELPEPSDQKAVVQVLRQWTGREKDRGYSICDLHAPS